MIQERVRTGGLMRCCTMTLAEYLEGAEGPSEEGQVMDCKYEHPGNSNLIFRHGAWEWNRERGTA